jgi:hypothetical protein
MRRRCQIAATLAREIEGILNRPRVGAEILGSRVRQLEKQTA